MVRRIVVDTNILVSAILSPDGAAREVLRRCLTGRYRPLIGNALFLEYEDVLSREKLFAAAPVGPEDREALLDAFLGACQWIEIVFLWRPNLPDEADNHPVELAVAGNAEPRSLLTTPGIWRQENWRSTVFASSRRATC